jgi:hypothetical protein
MMMNSKPTFINIEPREIQNRLEAAIMLCDPEQVIECINNGANVELKPNTFNFKELNLIPQENNKNQFSLIAHVLLASNCSVEKHFGGTEYDKLRWNKIKNAIFGNILWNYIPSAFDLTSRKIINKIDLLYIASQPNLYNSDIHQAGKNINFILKHMNTKKSSVNINQYELGLIDKTREAIGEFATWSINNLPDSGLHQSIGFISFALAILHGGKIDHSLLEKCISYKENKLPLIMVALRYKENTAERSESFRLLEKMIDGGFNPNSIEMPSRKIASMVAAKEGNVDALRILVEGGARLNIPDNLGKTTFDYAEFAPTRNRDEVLEFLDTCRKSKILNVSNTPVVLDNFKK